MNPDQLTAFVPQIVPEYELLRPIGRGSYGEVWLGRNVMGRYRAVKLVNRASFSEERLYEREFTGARHYDGITRSHEGLVSIFHVGKNDSAGCYYYVMELADDASGLAEFDPEKFVPHSLARELAVNGPLPAHQCVRVGIALCNALVHLHRHGLIHRDIKPSNIIFVHKAPKLADVGLVAQVGGSRSFVGTEGYVPPEGPGSTQADLYALGKVLYEISTGNDPKEFPRLPAEWGRSGELAQLKELNEILLRACDNDPSKRYGSAEEMLGDLLVIQVGKSVKRLRLIEIRAARLAKLFVGTAAFAVVLLAGWFWTERQREISESNFRQSERLRTRALIAERQASGRLQEALHAQAQQSRMTRQLGQRLKALGALRDLAAVQPSATARDEAIAALALLDLDAAGSVVAVPPNATAYGFDGDLRLYAVGTADGALQIGTFGGNTKILREAGAKPRVDLLHFSEDVRWLAVRYRDARCEIWDLEQNQVVLETQWISGYAKPDRAFDFATKANRAASAVNEKIIQLFDLPSWKESSRLETAERPTWLEFDATGNRLLVIAHKQATIWNVTTRTIERALTLEKQLFSANWDYDGKRIAIGTTEGEIILWDLRLDSTRAFQGHAGNVIRVRFTPEDDKLVSAATDNSSRIWDITSGRTLLATDAGLCFGINRDGNQLALVRQRQQIDLFNIIKSKTYRTLEPLAGTRAWVPDLDLDISQDGKHVVMGTGGGWTAWNIINGRIMSGGQNTQGEAVQFAPQSGKLLVGSVEGVRLLELLSSAREPLVEQAQGALVWEKEGITRLGTEHAGMGLLVGSVTDAVILDLGKEMRGPLQARSFSATNVCDLALSPDRQWLAWSGFHPRGTEVHNVRDASRSLALGGRPARLAFSPNGDTLVAGSGREYQFWSVGDWSPGPKIQREITTESPGPVAFSPDGKLVAIAQTWKTIKLLNATTKSVLASFSSPEPAQVSALKFTHDSNKLLVGTGTRAVEVWDLKEMRAALGDLGLASVTEF